MRTLSYKFFSLLKYPNNKNVIGEKIQNSWKWSTQLDIVRYVNNAVEILEQNNVKQNDRIFYKGKNTKEFLAWNLAANAKGCIWVSTYEDQSIHHVNHILKDSKPKLFISDNDNDLDKIYEYDNNIITNKLNKSDKTFEFKQNSYDISTLIYTSGTSSLPKGVILTNSNILSNIEAIERRFSDHDKQMTSLNILPWSHVFGYSTELWYNILNGNSIAIAQDKTKFVDNLREIKPQYIYVVPKVLDLIKNKVEKLEPFPLSDFTIPTALKYLFGGNIKNIFIGGAKLNPSTGEFFEKHGFFPCEGYGLSETSPVISVNHNVFPRDIKSVGKILDNVIVEIVNNEIHVAGPSIMKGYWGKMYETKKSFKMINNKKFYKTGDFGYVRDDFLYFTGRKSDNYKLSNGKFVDVFEIENIVKNYVDGFFIIYGENLDYNVLITDSNISNETKQKINENLESYQKISKILKVETSFFESNLTKKLSINRKNLVNQLNHPILKQ